MTIFDRAETALREDDHEKLRAALVEAVNLLAYEMGFGAISTGP